MIYFEPNIGFFNTQMKWLFFNSYFCRFVTGLGIQLLDFKLKKVTLIYFEPNIKIQMKWLFFNSYFIFDWEKFIFGFQGLLFIINLTSIWIQIKPDVPISNWILFKYLAMNHFHYHRFLLQSCKKYNDKASTFFRILLEVNKFFKDEKKQQLSPLK